MLMSSELIVGLTHGEQVAFPRLIYQGTMKVVDTRSPLSFSLRANCFIPPPCHQGTSECLELSLPGSVTVPRCPGAETPPEPAPRGTETFQPTTDLWMSPV